MATIQYALNKDSNHVYRVTREYTNNHGDLMVEVQRMSDGFTPPALFKSRFSREYRLVSQEEALSADGQQSAPETPDWIERTEKHRVKEKLEQSQVGLLAETTERDDLDSLVLYPETKEQVEMGLDLITRRDELDDEWGLSETSPMKDRLILNLHGAPGTGKTQTARAIAHKLGKPLLIVDYAELISKWVGDTGKHTRQAFLEAKEAGAVLFFDEADSLLSKRIADAGEGTSQHSNQNKNIFMQELDRHDGIVLTATNFFSQYDPAILRRISQHIEFALPNCTMREKLFQRETPAKAKAKGRGVKWSQLASASEGLSGGDIKTVCQNAVLRAASQRAKSLTQEHFMAEIKAVLESKKRHSGEENRRPMGLHASVK